MPGDPASDRSTDLPTEFLTEFPAEGVHPVSPEVRTSIDLDASIEEVLEALQDPELLSAWLGPWVEHGDDGNATVRTDDGRSRLVTDRRWSENGVRWRWQDASADGATTAASEVTIRLTEVDGRTRLMLHEAQLHTGARHGVDATRHGSIVLESATWLAGLLALGAVLAASSLVRV